MGTNYRKLTPEERYTIARLYREKQSIRKIATALDRAPSTVAGEVARNKTKTKGYDAVYAQAQTASRRWRGSKLERQPALRTLVLQHLAMGWSPQQVAGRLALTHHGTLISYESIYRFIAAQICRTKDYSWRHYLPYGKAK